MTKDAPSIRARIGSALDLMEAAIELGFTDPADLAKTIKLGQAVKEFVGKQQPRQLTEPRYMKQRNAEGDHIITRDAANGLEWDISDFGGKEFTFDKAQKACAELRTGEHSDWRLPTIQELLTLVDYTRSDPAIDKEYFPNCKPSWYRTSTPYAPLAGYSWIVYFGVGFASGVHHGNGSSSASARCGPVSSFGFWIFHLKEHT